MKRLFFLFFYPPLLLSIMVGVVLSFTSCDKIPGLGGAVKKDTTGGVTPKEQQEFLQIFSDASNEFAEMARPSKVKCWVNGLMMKVQPGEDMPNLITMKEGEEGEYLYQRTVRKHTVTLRGQTFTDSWYLIKTDAGSIGWVHGGGISFVKSTITVSPEGVTVRGVNARTATGVEEKKNVEDRTVVPGKKAGPITKSTTEQDLGAYFGPDNLKRGSILISDIKKGKDICTYVFPDSDEEIAVVWKDSLKNKVKAVVLEKVSNAQWFFPEGLYAGIPLQDLVKINKSPVSFYGFDWQYGGTVSSWRDGALKKYDKHFYAVLKYNPQQSIKEAIMMLRGDKVFTSNEKALEKTEVFVQRIVVYLD